MPKMTASISIICIIWEPAPGERRAMPFAFRCGRLVVLVLDSRGARDVFRPAPEMPMAVAASIPSILSGNLRPGRKKQPQRFRYPALIS